MEGQEYTFTLNVSEPASGLWGSASITLVSNHPPYGGFCTLSPDDSLYFLETVVSYSCSGTVISLLLLFHTQVMALRTDVFLAIFFPQWQGGWMMMVTQLSSYFHCRWHSVKISDHYVL